MSQPVPEGNAASTALAGPTARPAAQRLPLRHLARTARLRAEPGALVFVDGRGRERRILLGPDGVTAAAHVGGPILTDVVPGSLGAVDLLRADGSRSARLELSDWVPEAVELSDPEQALRRSGLPEVLAHAGLALQPVPTSQLAEAIDARPPSLLPRPGLPSIGYTALRALAVLAAFFAVGLGLITDATPGRLAVVAAGLLLASSVWAAGLWAVELWRDRRPATTAPVLRPHPGSPVSRRFRRVAQLRLEPDEIVVVDTLGGERWLPRTGAHAVDHAEVVREGSTNGQVELRTADGTARATLPWDPWCGGPQGVRALEEVCRAGGLPLVRPGVPARRDRDDEVTARAVYGPADPTTAAAALSYPPGLPGSAAAIQSSAFALLLVVVGLLPDAPDAVVPLAVATLVLTAGLPLGRFLGRRLWLDRPA